jgi:hypothetical protein
MKRLLAYLFIVLGLGLTFNVNAKAGSKASLQCNDKDWNGNDITWRTCENNSKSEIVKTEIAKEIKNGYITNSYWLDDKKTKPIILATYYENDCPLYGSISYIRPETEMVSDRIVGLYSDCNMFS